MLSACVQANTPVLHNVSTNSKAWRSNQPVLIDLLAPQGGMDYALDIVLRHDNRIARTEIPLSVRLLRGIQPLRSDTVVMVAGHKGRLPKGFVATGEAELRLSPIRIDYAGRYRVELRPANGGALRGIVSVGVALSPIAPMP